MKTNTFATMAACSAALLMFASGCSESPDSGAVISNPAQPEMRVAAKDGKFAWRVAPIGESKAETRLVELPWKPGARGVEAVWKDASGAVVRIETYELPDYDDFVARQEEMRDQIRIPFEMPFDGKATIAIDGPDGRRVRNLVKGIEFPAGANEVVWDGYAEDGTLVAPGEYAVRVVTHKGLSYEFKNAFANGGETEWMSWGPNHTAFCSLVAKDGLVSASSLFTEGGKSTVVMDLDGHKQFGIGEGWSFGNDALFHVAGPGERYYSVREANGQLQCFAYNWHDANKPRTRLEGAPETRLAGAAAIGGKIYVSNRASSTIDVYDLVESDHESVVTFTGERRPVAFAGPLASFGDTLVEPLSTNQFAIATDGKLLYALERGSDQVHVYDLATKEQVRTIGEPGGPYVGKWRKNRLVRPTAICCDGRGKLWITEHRFAPKRISRWDAATGECEIEKFGGERYGTPGGGMDYADRTRWIAHDCLFSVDWETGREQIEAVLLPIDFEGSIFNGLTFCHYSFFRRAGRTFVIGMGMCSYLFELVDGDHLVPLALFGNTHRFINGTVGDRYAQAYPPFLEACRMAYPDSRESDEEILRRVFNDQSIGLMWKDLDRDGTLDAEEFQIVPEAKITVGYWGFYPESLDPSVTVADDSGYAVMRFDAGSLEGDSLPEWDLRKAYAERIPSPDPMPRGQRASRDESFADSHGRSITLCTTPYMMCFGPTGRLEWYMDNPFPGVHGAQKADLPKPGELQGLLFDMGTAPFTPDADIFATINDHGRVFFITTDGIYLDELFSDCRVSACNDETLIGGEAFGGSFHRDETSGEYIFSAGGGGYRRYVIHGLETVSEKRSTLAVSQRQVAAAERNPPAAVAAAEPRSAVFPGEVEWATGNSTIKVRASALDDGAMRLRWETYDPSPWVNNGTDPYLMFKTGDCVDFQFIDRDGKPVRLQISPKAGDPDATQAVLYRHEAGKGEGLNPHDFSSPWRTHHVDDVQFRDDVAIRVSRAADSYAVEADIPAALLPVGDWTCDFGVIYGDAKGEINLSRFYWSNKETGLVNDVPGEIIPQQAKWGTIRFAAGDGEAQAAGEGAALSAPQTAGKRVATSAPQAAKLRFAGYLSNPHGALANANDRGNENGAGPVWDAARGVLIASAGPARVRAMRLDGTLVAEYSIPGNPSWGRFDTMTIAENGDVFVLAGGSNVARHSPAHAKLWKIPAGAPSGTEPTLVAEDVYATSANIRDGRLAVIRRDGAMSLLDVATLAETPFGTNTIRNANEYPCMYDWLPDGTFACVIEHRNITRFGADGAPASTAPLFGDREIVMEVGHVIGDTLWSLYGETIKRYDAHTLHAAPGVVIGGASGYFLGRVVREQELDARGICEIGRNLYAVLSGCNHAIYILRYDTTTHSLVKVRRIGGIIAPANLAIDPEGYVIADNMFWRFDDEPLAAPCGSATRMAQRATAVLPTGYISDICDAHGFRLEYWTGKLSGELSVKDYGTDSKQAPDIPRNPGQPQRWSETPYEVSFAAVEGEKDIYDISAIFPDGARKIYRVNGYGRPVNGDGWFREEKGKAPDPDIHQARDGEYVAVTSTSGGKLSVYREDAAGARTLVDEHFGLQAPTRVAIGNGRVVVFESGAQRLARFTLE